MNKHDEDLDNIIYIKKCLEKSRQYPLYAFTEGFDLARLYRIEDVALENYRWMVAVEEL